METKNTENIIATDNAQQKEQKSNKLMNWAKFIGILALLAVIAKLLSWLLG
jgi:hypothetical protein